MKKAFLSSMFVLVSTLVFSQKSSEKYEAFWLKVQHYELQNLPKSALQIVDSIYIKAKKTKNHPQLIKTLLYKSKFALTLEENAQLIIINKLQKEIKQSNFPAKNVYESILAELYLQYFQQNRWKFYNRTTTSEKVDKTDFRTWDLNTIFKEIQLHYNNSLNNTLELQLVNLNEFDEILSLSENSKTFHPTLYDFLAHRAIDFYKDEEQNLTKPAYKFEIDNAQLLRNNQLFTSEKISSKDSISNHLQALKIYKNLTLFHLNSGNKTALIKLSLERLDFVKTNAIFNNTNEIYHQTLLELSDEFKDNEAVTEVNYQLAKLYNEQASTYNSKLNTEHQFKRKTALTICDIAISKFPTSSGSKKCEHLKQQILQKDLHITVEKHIPTNTNSRLLVSYKNLDNIFLSAYKISTSQLEDFNKIYNDSTRIAFINKLKPSKKWNSTLKNESDYQQHTTELILPELENGHYLITATIDNESITSEKLISYGFAQATNLALIENNSNEYYTYQVVDRNTGKPLKNAKVNLKNYNTGRYNKAINKNFVTDENGQFYYKNTKYTTNIVATVNYLNDSATFGDYYFYENRLRNNENIDESISIKPFVFTDRSIYRPGQTVYFKAILLKKQGKKTDVFQNEFIEVSLENPNGETVKTLDLKLNEFGSVSGEFILPTTGLTGEYTINITKSNKGESEFFTNEKFYFDYYKKTISVEEYKRPKFETEFNPVTESFKLNDSITVFGEANAFAGSTISNAKVIYRVKRTANFPRWYNWRSPNFYQSEELEITSGITTTNDEGKFEIVFIALPDLKVKAESLPTFNYQITADVTDINGETRSTETTVKVGYHTLEASIEIPNKIDKSNKETKFSVKTTNLNGEFVPTIGTLKIIKLIAPNHPLRNRPWDAPDYQLISKENFEKLFPHDPYSGNENDVNLWEQGEAVFNEKIDTEKTKELLLGNTKKWKSGNYKVIFECTDKFGQIVKDEQIIELFGPNEKSIPDNKLFTISTNKSFYKPTDIVELTIGSASKDITVTLQIEKNRTIIESQFIHLNNETKTLKIPVNKEDEGGFAIKYHFVNYNSFQSGTIPIAVPFEQDNLQIETLTFRDKLQPGSNQTWSFKISGKNTDKIAAEVLASMYDVSLDQFKTHSWHFNPIQNPTYYSHQISNANNSFGTNNFTLKNQSTLNYSTETQHYDALNWFGFSFNNNRWINQQYLNRIRPIIVKDSFDATKQAGFIYGTVYDSSGLPLPGVTITIKGSNKGVQTDFDGNYIIEALKGTKLIFSFIGMNSSEVKIDKNNIVNVHLSESSDALEEVVVVGYGKTMKRDLTGVVTGVQIVNDDQEVSETQIFIRGAGSFDSNEKQLYIVDGVIYEENPNINASEITSIDVLKDAAATAIYGAKGANGVVLITTKKGQEKLKGELLKVKTRTNFQETAFFFPQLKTDKSGAISFSFTMPESLTRWKLQLLAHTKNLQYATKTLTTVTQKDLMVLPNAPRFLREGDEIVLSSKISNLATTPLNGTAILQLTDAISGKEIDELLGNQLNTKNFSIDAKGNTQVSWKLNVPENIQAIQYKIIAKAGDFSDGEQNVLPVLSNRMLVTETLPMWVRSNETKTFSLDKLKNTSNPLSAGYSTTLKNHKLTLEITSNPAWYAIQSLPYLMEYPYECAEQTFSRYYANTLASHILTSNPRIKEVFNLWQTSDALVSNLEKNEELKSIIINETPWLRDAQSETEQKKRIALLFDLNKIANEQEIAINKLADMQFNNGGFPWFKGSNYPNRYITQHIATGFGHLKQLNVSENSNEAIKGSLEKMIGKTVQFLDDEIENDYYKLQQEAKKIKEKAKTTEQGLKDEAAYLAKNHLNTVQIQYLYMRSFYGTLKTSKKTETAINYYTNQAAAFWKENKLYSKGLIALILHRNGNKYTSAAIIKSLKENSITSEEMGMYWKENTASWYWYQAPIETQALLIELFSEIEKDTKIVDELKVWLLKNKQTNQWKTTKATTEAVYALLLQGSDWLSVNESVEVTVGTKKIEPSKLENVKIEAGTGYFKTSWNGNEITPEMGNITISKKDKGIAWGGVYWQYFEDLDKITSAETPLKLSKKLFLKTNSDTGKKLTEINANTKLKVGDLLTVRIELKVDRPMDFIHMKDMRASGLEPINVLSQYKWQDGLGYYESTKDASTNFFFDHINKGVYIFEYDLRVNNSGSFSNGITTIQSMYAPEFSSHSEGIRIVIE